MLPEVIVLYFLKDCGYTEYNKPVLISGEVVKILVLSSQHKTSQNCSAFFVHPLWLPLTWNQHVPCCLFSFVKFYLCFSLLLYDGFTITVNYVQVFEISALFYHDSRKCMCLRVVFAL
jgi:hypothetical protein